MVRLHYANPEGLRTRNHAGFLLSNHKSKGGEGDPHQPWNILRRFAGVYYHIQECNNRKT